MTRVLIDFSNVEFDALRNAIEACRRWLQDETAALEHKREEEARTTDEAYDDFVMRWQEREGALEVAGEVLLRSLFISIYSEIEFRLDAHCRGAKRDRGLALSLGDIFGKGVRRAGVYLGKVVGVDLGSIPQWQDLLMYNTIRNAYVHNQGQVKNLNEEDMKAFRAYIEGHPSLTLTGLQVHMGEGFCLEALDSAQRFFEQLHAKLPLEPVAPKRPKNARPPKMRSRTASSH